MLFVYLCINPNQVLISIKYRRTFRQPFGIFKKDNFIIFFENAAWLPEGAPVFDADENLVGVYTQVNKQHSLFYISAYLRGVSNNLPPELQDLNNSIIQKEVEKLKEMEKLSDEIKRANQTTDSIYNSIKK